MVARRAPRDHPADRRLALETVETLLRGVVLILACRISFWAMTEILARVVSISRDDDLLGGMWAVVATVFVYRYSLVQSEAAALSRIAATAVSFVLCFAYLMLWPFTAWGMRH